MGFQPGEHAFLESILAPLDAWQRWSPSIARGNVRSAFGVVGGVSGDGSPSVSPSGGLSASVVTGCEVEKGWIGSVWIAMCRGAGGRIEVGAPQVAAEKQIFWVDCSGKYRTSGLGVGVWVARGPRGGPHWRVAACCDRFALEQVSAAISVRGGEERGEDDHGEDRRGAAEGARSRGGESCRDIGPRIGGPALPALVRRRGARARCGVEKAAEDGVHGDHESGCDAGHGREAVCARRCARANRSGFGGGLGGGERV